MNKNRTTSYLAITGLCVTALLGCSSVGFESPANAAKLAQKDTHSSSMSFDLAQITCWDVMTVSEEQRGTLLFLLYGYASGSAEKTLHTGKSIEAALRNTGTSCADNPDDSALDTMSKYL